MERRFQVFVRQHENDAFTVRALTHSHYATYGHDVAVVREQLAAVLAGELALGTIGEHDETFHAGLAVQVVSLTLRAVQHGRLMELPFSVTALWRPAEDMVDRFEVLLPRFEQTFVIRGRNNIEPWCEEIVRGRFHLMDVDEVRKYERDRAERLDELVVQYRKHDAKRLLVARGPQSERVKPSEDTMDAPPDDAILGGKGTDLLLTAARGELGRCYGRDEMFEPLERMLIARKSVLLIGAPGVGKTALVHELAHRRYTERGLLRSGAIWHVPPARVMAGTRFLGQWQERWLEVIGAVRSRGAILYLGDLLELVHATGSASASGMTLPGLLAPLLGQRELTLVLEATPDAVSVAEACEPGFVERLGKIVVPPLAGDRAFQVLERLAESIGRTHRVGFTAAVLQRALDLIARFGDADGLPGSGIALLEQCARSRKGRDVELEPEDVTEAFCSQTGFPREIVDPDMHLDLAEVDAYFRERIHGQPEVIEQLSNVVAVLKAGLSDPERPVASFLLLGPTGVGKTESALCLAEFLFRDRKRVVRLDMSEYGHSASAMRLVDGVDGVGDLTGPLRRQPFCVVLLDEVEKAAHEVFDVLLQVLGEGRLTDGTGRTVSFRHAIVMMTSNLGASSRGPVGIESHTETGPDYAGAIRRFFRPEFLNRIDSMVPFRPLDRPTLRTIAKRLLQLALGRDGLTRRGVVIEVEDSVIELLARVGFDPNLGARPMKRAIDEHVLAPLAARLSREREPSARWVLRATASEGCLVLRGPTSPAEGDEEH